MTPMMPMTKVANTVLAVAVALGASGTVAAEPAATEPSPARNAASMSPQAQTTAARALVTRGQQLAQRIAQQLDEARRESDMIRITCLNDKLTQVNANLRTANARMDALAKATDNELRNHEFTVLTVLGQKFQVLDQEANQCVGQDLYETGATKRQTEVDTSLQPFEDSPSEPPVSLPSGIPDVPVFASETK